MDKFSISKSIKPVINDDVAYYEVKWKGYTETTLVPSMICTIVQFSVQDCAFVEIRRFHHNVTRNIVTMLSSFLASMVECMGLSPG
jgi:hypothetical protein